MLIKLKTNQGFTIVETLIVLSVSAVLFVSTSVLIRGQVETYRYRNDMASVQQHLQQVIKDTENGDLSEGSGWGVGDNGCSGTGLGISSNCIINGVKLTFNTQANTIVKVPLVKKIGSPDSVFAATNSQTYNMPASLKITKVINDDATAASANAIMNVSFTATGLVSNAPQNVLLFDGDGSSNTTPLSPGKKICISGVNNGSIVIGKDGSKSVVVNLVDIACN
jgi:prepilin-type N-terminal cleavage/methylation domain-containing protein